MTLYNKMDEYAKLFLQGEDIEEYTEDELCNNPDFMKALIRLDKKSYIYMSDELKKDFEFIRDVVKENKDDYDFCSILIEGLEEDCVIDELDEGDLIAFNTGVKIEEEIKQANIRELYAIVTENILRDSDLLEKDKKGYAVKLNSYYTMILGCVMNAVNKDPESNELGYGFGVIKEFLVCNPVLLKYFAERLTLDIIDEEESVTEYSNNTELVIHNAYASKEEYEKEGFVLALAKIIRPYDPFLYDYLVINKDNDMFKRFAYEKRQILNNWDLLESNNRINKSEEFTSNITQALDQLHIPCVYTMDVIAYMRENYGKDFSDDLFDPYYEQLEQFGINIDGEEEPSRIGVEFIQEGLEKNDIDTIKLIDYATYLYGQLTKARIVPKDAEIKTFEEYFRDKKENKAIQRNRKRPSEKDN